jgi:predicted SprT family Zn-dependent metalloprotease
MDVHRYVYKRAVCQCGSKMISHVTTDSGAVKYGCWSCKRELPKEVVDKVESEEWYPTTPKPN